MALSVTSTPSTAVIRQAAQASSSSFFESSEGRDLLTRLARFVNRLPFELSGDGSALHPSFSLASIVAGPIYAGLSNPEAIEKMRRMILDGPNGGQKEAASILLPSVMAQALQILSNLITYADPSPTSAPQLPYAPRAVVLNGIGLNASGVKPQFQRLMETNLKAKIFSFEDRQNVGKWLNEQAPKSSQAMAKSVVGADMFNKLGADDVLLFGCTFLKAYWEKELDEKRTHDRDFQCLNGERICVKAMEGVIEHTRVRACFVENHMVVALPFKLNYKIFENVKNLTYVFIIPDDPAKIGETKKKAHEILEKSYKALFSGQPTRLHVILPKQRFNIDQDYIKPLVEAGYPVDTPLANILDAPDTHLSQLRCKIQGEQNEKGMELVAAISGAVSRSGVPSLTPLRVNALQPFVGCVISYTNALPIPVSLVSSVVVDGQLLVPGAGAPAPRLTFRELPDAGIEKLAASAEMQAIRQPIANLITRVTSAVRYDVGNGTEVSVINCSSWPNITLNMRRELLVDGRAVRVMKEAFAEPFALSGTAAIIFEHNRKLCLIERPSHYWVISHEGRETKEFSCGNLN